MTQASLLIRIDEWAVSAAQVDKATIRRTDGRSVSQSPSTRYWTGVSLTAYSQLVSKGPRHWRVSGSHGRVFALNARTAGMRFNHLCVDAMTWRASRWRRYSHWRVCLPQRTAALAAAACAYVRCCCWPQCICRESIGSFLIFVPRKGFRVWTTWRRRALEEQRTGRYTYDGSVVNFRQFEVEREREVFGRKVWVRHRHTWRHRMMRFPRGCMSVLCDILLTLTSFGFDFVVCM